LELDARRAERDGARAEKRLHHQGETLCNMSGKPSLQNIFHIGAIFHFDTNEGAEKSQKWFT
jgi:hypothetical protein